MLAAGVALVASAALLAPTGAAAACPAGSHCTNESGEYALTVPPLTGNPIFGAYADCVWQVHVDFGDGTGADYVFEGDKGLSGTHTFPQYGEYQVIAALSNGYHKNSPPATCPPYTEIVTVLYQDPSEPETPPKQEPKEEKPKEKPGGKPGGGSTGSGGGKSGGQGGGEEGEAGGGHPISIWSSCSHGVYAHRVPCGKARRVIEGAQEKLADRSAARAAGFQCHLTKGLFPISCRRGKGRVLGPLG